MNMPLIVTTAAVAAAISCAAAAQTLGIASTAPGTYTNSTSTAIAKAIIDKTGLQARVQPQGSSPQLAVETGKAQFGLSNSFDTTFFVTGTGDYEGRGRKENLRLIGNITPLTVAMFVREDSGIKTIAELKGKQVPAGFSAQKTIGRIIEAHLVNAGISYDDVEKVLTPNVAVSADDFMSGKTDAFCFALGSAKVKQADSEVGGVRALPIDDSPAAMERIQQIMPGAYAMTAKPSPRLDGVLAPTPIIAFDFLLTVNGDVPDDVVYKVTKAIHDSKDILVATFPALRTFDPDNMVKPYKALEYHPGAIKYYKEIGAWPPKG